METPQELLEDALRLNAEAFTASDRGRRGDDGDGESRVSFLGCGGMLGKLLILLMFKYCYLNMYECLLFNKFASAGVNKVYLFNNSRWGISASANVVP